LAHPTALYGHLKTAATFNVIWDIGASVCISSNASNFVGSLLLVTTVSWLKGIVKGLKLQGQGHVLRAFHNVNGQLHSLKNPAYYIPNCCAHLLSTTFLLQSYPDEEITHSPHVIK
jgi:hypothetical protein